MKLTLITALIGLTAATVYGQFPQGETKSGDGWMPLDCKTLDHWPDYTVNPANLELSKYGGWLKGPRQTASGFFRVQKVNGRWWCVDPEGYLYIHKALNSVNMDFDTADVLYAKMREYGFNGFGNWTWNGPTGGGPADRSIIAESTVKDTIPMAYTPRFGMIGSYRNERLPAGTPRIELPVFDPGFEQRAPGYAQAAITDALKNDPHLFGYFTDNELPFNTALQEHLKVTDTTDPNYVAAVNFLASRGKTPPADPDTVDGEDAKAYTALCGERYYSVVRQAIRAVDPNHMYIGSRCHSGEKGNQAFMENAGKYVDIMSVNHYHHWGDRRINTNALAEWLGRPLMFTEFYVKSLEDGDSAENGAGFNGRNLTSGANFYQNFVTTHLESGNLVGFHWFKYGAIIGEAGALKQSGSFNNVLFDSMKRMHTQLYNFIDYVDSRPAPDVALTPEADAYVEYGANRSDNEQLLVKYGARQTYMRFDVSELGNQIDSAKIVLRTVQSGGYAYFQVELVEDDSWDETTINGSNSPAGSTVIRAYSDGRSDLEIDVSSVIRREIDGDGKLSIRIIGVLSPEGVANGTIPAYGSRRHSNPLARPLLVVDYPNWVYWDGVNGNWDDVANWSTDPGATAPNPADVPGTIDELVFNVTSANPTSQTISLNGTDQSAKSLTFSSTGATTFQRSAAAGGTTSSNLKLGRGGLTVSPGAGEVIISPISPTDNPVNLLLDDSLSMANNSSKTLILTRGISTSASLGNKTLTFNGSGSGVTEITTALSQGTGTTLSVNVNTTGGILYFRTGNSFSGGLTLTQGTVASRGSSTLGGGRLTLSGGAFGSVGSSRTYGNLITINGDFQLGGVSVPTNGSVAATGSSNSTFNGNVDLAGGTRTITVGGNTNTFAGVIDNGGLTVSTTGSAQTLVLSGVNTYSGPTTVGANVTLRLNQNGALQNSALNTDGGGNVALGHSTLLTINTPTLGGLNGTTNLASVLTTNYNLATGLTLNPQSGTASYSGNITDGAAAMTLTKTGSGTQILSGSSAYTGATNVNVGTLAVTGSLTSAVTVASGATLSGSGETTGTLTLNGGSTIVGTTVGVPFKAETIVANSSVNIALLDGSGPIGSRTIGVARYNTGTGPNTANFSTAGYRNGVISNVGTSGGETQLTFSSEARTWDSASGSWDSDTVAWLEGDQKFALGDVVTFDDNGTGGGSARIVTLNSLVNPGSVTFNNNTTTPYNVSGTGSIGGTTGLTKSGDGMVTLSNTNTYTGATHVNAGTLTLGHATDTLSGPVNINGGTLNVDNPDKVGAVTLTSGTISGDSTLTGSSYAVESGTVSAVLAGSGVTLTKTTGGTVILSGANTYDGLTTVSAGTLTLGHATDTLDGDITVSGGTLDVANPDTVGAVTLISGTISGDSTLTATSYAVESGAIGIPLAGSGAALTKTTSGTVLLTNSGSSYTGGTVLDAGKIGLRASGTPLGTGTVTINGGAIGAVVSARSISNYILITNNFQLGGINAPGLGNSGTTFSGDVDLGGATRTIALADGTTINGNISNGGITLNATSANRTLTIGADSVSTYTGPTTISVGGLIINGDLSAATGAINVTSGATLGGNGTIGGTVTIASGSGLSSRITDWTGAAGTGYDDLAVASLDAGGGVLKLVVTTTGLSNFTESNKSFTILNSSGAITGFNPENVTITATGFTGTGTWALAQVGSSLVLKYTGDDPYQKWIAPHSVADESMGGDSDRDGANNLMEFVLNGNPGKSDTSILPDLEINSPEFTFTYIRRIDSLGVPQVVQYGSDLSEWEDVAIPTVAGTTTVGSATVVVGEPAGGTQTVTVRIPPSGPEVVKLFGRLKVGH
jgi:autotransporter-associated beta strand protein